MASRTADQITLVASTAAGAVITYQVWTSDASPFTTSAVALFALVNLAWTLDALRRNQAKHTIACPEPGCDVQITMTGAKPAEQVRLTALATDHSRHGGTR
ncbi:hypothetical protein [Streptomyces sp. NPDC006551]|uniref:hypothetical protein n=1 Tax=Streptomyces sp. NPDC006551 TaxID=3157178 RepID=UPI0033BBF45A